MIVRYLFSLIFTTLAFAQTTPTPNMNLQLPVVGQEIGPNWANDLNAALTVIDQHDHSPGKGVPITPAGMRIDPTTLPLNFNDWYAQNMAFLNFTAQSSATNTTQSVSVAPASGINELWYTDSNGTSTQITKNGEVNATASSIPGESYSSGTFIWDQTQDSLPTTPANFDIGSITIRPNSAGALSNGYGITIAPPSGTTSSWNFTLPSIPAANSFMQYSTSGVVSASVPVSQGITASNIANGTITATQISSSANILGTQLLNNTIGLQQLATSVLQWQSQTFSTSGSFSLPPNVNQLYIVGCGGGGGGGSGAIQTATASFPSGGNGGNGSIPTLAIIPIPTPTPSPTATYAVTIGSGGSGGSGISSSNDANGFPGTAGGASIVGISGPSFTGNRTSGSQTITSVSSLTGLSVGMVVAGTGLQNFSWITAIGASTITLSAPATSGSSTGTSIASYSYVTSFIGGNGGGGGTLSGPSAESGDVFTATAPNSGGGSGGEGQPSSSSNNGASGNVGSNSLYALGGGLGLGATHVVDNNSGGGGGGGGASFGFGGNGSDGKSNSLTSSAGGLGGVCAGGGGSGGVGGGSGTLGTVGAGGAGGNGEIIIYWLGAS